MWCVGWVDGAHCRMCAGLWLTRAARDAGAQRDASISVQADAVRVQAHDYGAIQSALDHVAELFPAPVEEGPTESNSEEGAADGAIKCDVSLSRLHLLLVEDPNDREWRVMAFQVRLGPSGTWLQR